MKKILTMFVVLSLFLVACNQESDKASEKDKEETKEKDETLKVDKGLLNVEVTLPTSFFGDQDLDKIITDAKSQGIDEVTKNEDGSLTYKMSKAKHKEMMSELETAIIETVDEIKESENFPSIKNREENKKFTEFTLFVNKEEFEGSFDRMASMGLAISSMYYQVFNGVDTDSNKVTIDFKDDTNDEIFETVIYPDDFNN